VLAWWLTVETSDPVRQSLGRGLIGVLTIMLVLDLPLLLVNLARDELRMVGANVVMFVLLVIAVISTRTGQRWGALLLGGAIMLLNTFASPLTTYIPLQVVPMPLISGVALITIFDTPLAGVVAYGLQLALMALAILVVGQPEGCWIWLATTAIILGGTLGFVAIGAQLFRTAIQQYARITADLEQRVADRTADLTHANAEKAALLVARQRAIFDVVHDARGFVQAIQGGVELALIDVEPLMATIPDAALSLRSAQQSMSRLTAMLKDLRDASMLEDQTLQLNPRLVDLAQVAQELTIAFQPTFHLHGLALTMDRPETPLYAWCDPDRTTRVIANFLTNARRYTSVARPDGDGVVQVQITTLVDWVVIGVRDNGPGMAQDELERLGQRFMRFSAGKTVPEGLGIGLNLSIGLIRASGGHVRVETAPGMGMRICAALPQMPAQPLETWPDPPAGMLAITL
jgi:signal transduction histidine kinase